MFVTGALCLGLHLLRCRQPWWGWYGILGIVLGLALLSKSSAVLAVPVVLGVLAGKLMLRRERVLRVWLGAIGAPLLICLSISGWHYLKLWREYGNPLIGGWDPRVFRPWWQLKGFQTAGYYFSFSESLNRPFLSGFHSFWDGFYSTLWGDGLLGGCTDLSRPPWNYDLMTMGFVLALVPTALVLTGLVLAVAGCFRRLTLPWLLLMAVGWLFAFAILDISLKVPYLSQEKAFFGLPALLPFCALGALGFEFWAGRGKMARYLFGVTLGIWLVNIYASFWIKPNTVQIELSSAMAAYTFVNGDSSEDLVSVLKHYPGNSRAKICLALSESKRHPELAVKRLEQALKDDPTNAQIESALAINLVLCERLDEAVVHAKRAVELAPEDEAASETWCRLALRHKDYKDAVTAGRDALSLNPADLGTHFNLGMALMELGQTAEAISHFSTILSADPTQAEARFCRGLCLQGQPGKQADGIADMREAVRLEPTNTVWQTLLQSALKAH
jgi:tetratricopeptide (TPR) repeat protein